MPAPKPLLILGSGPHAHEMADLDRFAEADLAWSFGSAAPVGPERLLRRSS
jgi:hypothetical protein